MAVQEWILHSNVSTSASQNFKNAQNSFTILDHDKKLENDRLWQNLQGLSMPDLVYLHFLLLIKCSYFKRMAKYSTEFYIHDFLRTLIWGSLKTYRKYHHELARFHLTFPHHSGLVWFSHSGNCSDVFNRYLNSREWGAIPGTYFGHAAVGHQPFLQFFLSETFLQTKCSQYVQILLQYPGRVFLIINGRGERNNFETNLPPSPLMASVFSHNEGWSFFMRHLYSLHF